MKKLPIAQFFLFALLATAHGALAEEQSDSFTKAGMAAFGAGVLTETLTDVGISKWKQTAGTLDIMPEKAGPTIDTPKVKPIDNKMIALFEREAQPGSSNSFKVQLTGEKAREFWIKHLETASIYRARDEMFEIPWHKLEGEEKARYDARKKLIDATRALPANQVQNVQVELVIHHAEGKPALADMLKTAAGSQRFGDIDFITVADGDAKAVLKQLAAKKEMQMVAIQTHDGIGIAKVSLARKVRKAGRVAIIVGGIALLGEYLPTHAKAKAAETNPIFQAYSDARVVDGPPSLKREPTGSELAAKKAEQEPERSGE